MKVEDIKKYIFLLQSHKFYLDGHIAKTFSGYNFTFLHGIYVSSGGGARRAHYIKLVQIVSTQFDFRSQ
jgi:hypothetical protein